MAKRAARLVALRCPQSRDIDLSQLRDGSRVSGAHLAAARDVRSDAGCDARAKLTARQVRWQVIT